ncbi:unnamed protein product [Rotaria magnacalcarata]|uniref:Uncharacterized protein n=1 Tax=Rotaria magnacalcarata TaxID=392030 RepID=A0A816WB40_9BILA|nr:unnamed protein product [Rotaria magnacalcarata]CAF2132804.1 unnamed protein product [Rotaria magnacalcarata]CAF4089227.1 unnamed protein product [Rotaria magnacalcarata]CAF4332176.1 unnamed protein product [Rotaria magnacalcarata]
MTENTVVELNQDVGCYLLRFIGGIDAINFIEAVNDSRQFRSIAKTSDYHFIQMIKVFCGHSRILLPRAPFEDCTNEYEIDDEQFILLSKRYYDTIEPSIRLYIHPCFSTEGFTKLCKVYQTSLFSCYSRLLPLNTVCYNYNADFGLLDYEWYGHTIGAERLLNDYEKTLFRVSTYFNKKTDQNYSPNMTFVHTIKEFKHNLADRFLSDAWLRAIDFSKWAIVGGCVLNTLCRSPFSDTKQQDVNLVYYANDILDFKKSIDVTVSNLHKLVSQDLCNEIKVERIPGTPEYNVFLPCYVRLKFTWAAIGNSKNPLSHVLHSFDMDICQIAFTGDKIVSTFPFLQALATKSFIVYSLHARSPKHLCTRIAKYCNRGFNLLETVNFDGEFDSLMEQEEIPLYRVEHVTYIDNDGEIQFATKEFHRSFINNVDTLRLQEKFMHMVCPQLLQYA